MTQCERIINENKLQDSFLKEEIRCDFFVSEERKKIWAISIDLMMELERVCKKHNLKYWVFFGTLLGTIRHKGFIPWDDDVDIVMPRSDYEKLAKLSQEEFKEPYFYQMKETDEGYFYSFNKLRNSETTAMKTFFRDTPMNKGIAIDIFPLDNAEISEDYNERYKKIKTLCIDESNYMRSYLINPTENEKKRIDSYSGRNPNDILNEISYLVEFLNNENTEYIGTNSVTVYPPEKSVYNKEWFYNTVYMEFEGVIKVPVPACYEEILKVIYGDYKKFPPLEKRGVWHYTSAIDPDVPFKDYIITKEFIDRS